MDGDDSLDGRPGISAQKREATNCLLKSRGFGGLLLSRYYYYHLNFNCWFRVSVWVRPSLTRALCKA